MTGAGFSSQKAMTRSSRMVTLEVVDDALSSIEEIRSYGFSPDQVLFMDETGLWSNVKNRQTYNFKNWFTATAFPHHFIFSFFLRITPHLSPSRVHVYSSLVLSSCDMILLILRGNPVVKEMGDRFRDTVALTFRGDGVDIPPYVIVHTYRGASYISGRRCGPDEQPVKGLNIGRMKDYICHVNSYVKKQSLLCMDRLSSHTSGKVVRYLDSFKLPNGERKFIPIFFAPKTAFLISPLDMGAIAAFKAYFHQLDRHTIDLKIRAVQTAWNKVSNESLFNICVNCGVVGDESMEALRERFEKEVVNAVPPEIEAHRDFYDSWVSSHIDVVGAHRSRGVTFDKPEQLSSTFMDGVYWNNYGVGTGQG